MCSRRCVSTVCNRIVSLADDVRTGSNVSDDLSEVPAQHCFSITSHRIVQARMFSRMSSQTCQSPAHHPRRATLHTCTFSSPDLGVHITVPADSRASSSSRSTTPFYRATTRPCSRPTSKSYSCPKATRGSTKRATTSPSSSATPRAPPPPWLRLRRWCAGSARRSSEGFRGAWAMWRSILRMRGWIWSSWRRGGSRRGKWRRSHYR